MRVIAAGFIVVNENLIYDNGLDQDKSSALTNGGTLNSLNDWYGIDLYWLQNNEADNEEFYSSESSSRNALSRNLFFFCFSPLALLFFSPFRFIHLHLYLSLWPSEVKGDYFAHKKELNSYYTCQSILNCTNHHKCKIIFTLYRLIVTLKFSCE